MSAIANSTENGVVTGSHMKMPRLLTVWIILTLIVSVFDFVFDLYAIPSYQFWGAPSPVMEFYAQLPGFFIHALVIWAMLQILQWKRVGIVFYICADVASLMLTICVDYGHVALAFENGIVSLAFMLAWLGILYIAIRPVWKNFK